LTRQLAPQPLSWLVAVADPAGAPPDARGFDTAAYLGGDEGLQRAETLLVTVIMRHRCQDWVIG